MAYDAILAGVMADELKELLSGAKIEKVQQPESDEVVLQLRSRAGRKKLLISLSPNGSRLHFTELSHENPQEAPNFCMLLRKHIQGGIIRSVDSVPGERIIRFDIESVNEMGYSVNKRLIAEIMGKYSNLILTELESGRIIDAVKRLSIDVNRYRQILPGGIYAAPPLNKSDYVNRMRENIVSEELRPVVYFENGRLKDVYPYELKSCASLEKRFFDDIHGALDFFYHNRKESNRQQQKIDNLTKSINALIDKQLLKKQRLLDDLQRARDAEIYRIKAELLTANLYRCKPGDKSVRLISYYDGSEIEVELDERLNAAKNAQSYYKKYAKLKSSAKEKLCRLEACETDIAYLNSVLEMSSLSSGGEELELLRQELAEEGFIRLKNSPGKNTRLKPKPRRFRLSTGYEIMVGRSNSENDYISFKLGNKSDYWFHAKDIHGSHLVLLTRGAEPDAQSIYEAAAIAAFYSKAKDSDKVPVDYLPLKYLRKAKAAKPGMVNFTRNKTVWVHPKAPEE